jgi:hypothetical protein
MSFQNVRCPARFFFLFFEKSNRFSSVKFTVFYLYESGSNNI